MSTLFEELGGKIPVWGISHGGHSLPDNISGLPDLNGNIHYTADSIEVLQHCKKFAHLHSLTNDECMMNDAINNSRIGGD